MAKGKGGDPARNGSINPLGLRHCMLHVHVPPLSSRSSLHTAILFRIFFLQPIYVEYSLPTVISVMKPRNALTIIQYR